MSDIKAYYKTRSGGINIVNKSLYVFKKQIILNEDQFLIKKNLDFIGCLRNIQDNIIHSIKNL